MQRNGLKLKEQPYLLDEFKGAIIGTQAEKKIIKVIEKNPGIEQLKQNIGHFLFARLTTCEVERFFSLMKDKVLNSATIKCEDIAKIVVYAAYSIQLFCQLFYVFLRTVYS